MTGYQDDPYHNPQPPAPDDPYHTPSAAPPSPRKAREWLAKRKFSRRDAASCCAEGLLELGLEVLGEIIAGIFDGL